jgi:glucose 1-dehydrogenase
MRLRQRTALVTGGAQGIGGGIARRYIEEGAAVFIVDVLAEQTKVLVEQLRAAGGRADFAVLDLATEEGCASAVPAALASLGSLDICVNCAGVAPVVDFLELSRSVFERTIAINLTAAFVISQAAARHMVMRGHGGVIINVSSVSARLANPGQTAYCASKAGLEGMTREMAVSLAPHAIRVNALAPGPTWTAMADANPQFVAPIFARTPLGRFSNPTEMAGTAVFLASDDAAFMTGATLQVDGGRAALNYTMPPRVT